MAEDRASKTEEPTARRLSQAHAKGQFAKSEELTMTSMLFALLIMVAFHIPSFAAKYMEFGRHMFANISPSMINPASLHEYIAQGVSAFIVLSKYQV